MAQAIPIIISIIGAYAASRGSGSSGTGTSGTGTSGTTDPDLSKAIQAMMARQSSQDPLFQALTNLGVNLLPNSAYKKYPGRTYGELFPTGDSTVDPNAPGGHAVPRPTPAPMPGPWPTPEPAPSGPRIPETPEIPY